MPSNPTRWVISRGGGPAPLTIDNWAHRVLSVMWAYLEEHDRFDCYSQWYRLDDRGGSFLWAECEPGDALVFRTRRGEPMGHRGNVFEIATDWFHLALCVAKDKHRTSFEVGLEPDTIRSLQRELCICLPLEAPLRRLWRRVKVFYLGW